VDFKKYKGKKAILVVNVACKWGLTSSNYKNLTNMYN
jgi:glutathione peroxidase-family protein